MKISNLTGLFSSEFCLISTRDGVNFDVGTRTGFLVSFDMLLHVYFHNETIIFLPSFSDDMLLVRHIFRSTSLQIVYWLPWNNILVNKLC